MTSWTQLLNFVGYPNNQGSLMGTESIGLDPQDTNRLYLACGWMGGSNPSGIMISPIKVRILPSSTLRG